jgi:co-chaperonin GroES (HSP10)
MIALGNRIFIKREVETELAPGILNPEVMLGKEVNKYSGNKKSIGVVVSVGVKYKGEIKPGDKIMYNNFQERYLEVEGEELIFLLEEDIDGILIIE